MILKKKYKIIIYKKMTLLTPLSPLTPLTVTQTPVSTITQSVLSPVGPSVVTNYNPLTITTAIGPTFGPLYTRPGALYLDIDTGVNDSYIVQRDVTRFLRYKTLDKWIYTEFPQLLKYLVVEKDTVRLVKNDDERHKNKVSNDPIDVLSEKSEYIEKNILTEEAMREILIRIMRETGIKWYDLPYQEQLVMDVVEKYIEKKLKRALE